MGFNENFKVNKVIFNCGTFNELEKDLIEKLDQKKIKYYSCVDELNIRLAGGELFFKDKNDYEIVSITGTLSKDGEHIHASFSDITGKTIGGHLSDGCIINTTAEIILHELEYTFTREYDASTGYKEIVMSK